ncbi:hypothetical protein [Paracoccus pacificus]|uniref:PH domain-containing protein n=1 Tax=Paracoccus pacificus TaxID=1463598 RepID=A0ABW4RA67_9RHOB
MSDRLAPAVGTEVFSPEELTIALDPGERVIWQGRPVVMVKSVQNQLFWRLFGGIFGVVGAIFLPIGVFVKDPIIRMVFLPTGLLFLAIAGAGFVLPRQFARKRLAQARYALTDKRAIVADGPRIRHWPITPDMILEFDASSPGSIIFDREPTNMTINYQPVMRDIGFLNIVEAPEVGQIIRRLQSGQTGAQESPNA